MVSTQRRFNRDTEVTSAAYLALAEWCTSERLSVRACLSVGQFDPAGE